MTTTIDYPADAPRLQPNTNYHLEIKDSNGGSSTQEQTQVDLSFVLLSDQEIRDIGMRLEQVQQLKLDSTAADFINAEIYANYELRADAISTLEALAARSNAPAILRRLADLYLTVGLYKEAVEMYARTLAEYQHISNPEGEALVLEGRGLAYRGDNHNAEAKEALEQALQRFEELGDKENSERVREEMRT